MILAGILKVLFFFVVFFVIAVTLIYNVFIKGAGNWSVLSVPMRYVTLFIYPLVAFYFGVWIFNWYLFIPDTLTFIINQIIGILSFFYNVDKIFFIWQLIGDLTVIPYLFLVIYMPVVIVDFKHDNKYNYKYRRFVLLIITLLYTYLFTIDNFAAQLEWYENALFLIIVYLSSIMTYLIIGDEYSKALNEKGLWEKIKYAFKLVFSRNNPLISLIRSSHRTT